MARARPKIPFMMFQDVIMAVFGILILIVIYLLINAKVSDIEFVEALEEMRQEKASLSDSVEVAEEQKKALYESAVKAVESREAVELSKQLEVNESRIKALDVQSEKLHEEVGVQAKELEQMVSKRFEAHPSVLSTRREVVAKELELDVLKSAVTTTKLKAEESEVVIEKTESYLEDIENQFRVEIDESLAGQSVYLIDLGGKKIRTFKVFNGEQTKVASPSVDELLRAINADPAKKRAFLFVRPDAISTFDEALDAFRENGIAVGYQPVPAGEQLILTRFPDGIPEVGAGGGVEGGDSDGGSAANASAGGSHSGADSRGAEGEGDGEDIGGGDKQESQGGESSSTATSSNTADSGESGQADSSDSEASHVAASDVDDSDEIDGSTGVEDDTPDEISPLSFKWLILLFIVILVIIILIVVNSSKR